MNSLQAVVVLCVIGIVGISVFYFSSIKESDVPKDSNISVTKSTSIISQEDAHLIAMKTRECSMAGILTDDIFYNDITKTWWFNLERMPELEKDGCSPACVVNGKTKDAEVNWRCTGALPLVE